MVSMHTFIEIGNHILGHVENAMARDFKALFSVTPEMDNDG
jgi:hypothetical protein